MAADIETRRTTELRKKMDEMVDRVNRRKELARMDTTWTQTQRCVKTLHELIKILENRTVIDASEAQKLRRNLPRIRA